MKKMIKEFKKLGFRIFSKTSGIKNYSKTLRKN
jgi:hypothetical protein